MEPSPFIGPLARLRPIKWWAGKRLKRTAKQLAQEIEAFLEERMAGHPPPNTHEQDSPEWLSLHKQKTDYVAQSVALFSERGLWRRVLDYAEQLEIEDARYPFKPSAPGGHNGIRKLAAELRKIARLKRLVR